MVGRVRGDTSECFSLRFPSEFLCFDHHIPVRIALRNDRAFQYFHAFVEVSQRVF